MYLVCLNSNNARDGMDGMDSVDGGSFKGLNAAL